MKSIQDHLDPELRGLLAEIALQPSSLLFGRANPKPTRWSGRERGLSNAEREVLRAHREALGFYVRLNSGYQQIHEDLRIGKIAKHHKEENSQRLVDFGVEAEEAWPLARKAGSRTGEYDLINASLLDVQKCIGSEAVISSLHHAQRVSPHPYTSQHLASWYIWVGQPQAAVACLNLGAAVLPAINSRDRYLRTLGDAYHSLDNWGAAASLYLKAYEEQPDQQSLLLAALNAVLSGDRSIAAAVGSAVKQQPLSYADLDALRALIENIDNGRSRNAFNRLKASNQIANSELFDLASELVSRS